MGTTIKNIDRLLKKINNIGNIDLKPVITKATLLVEGQAKELCPVDTGNLKGSIHPDVQQKGKLIVGRVYTTLEYAMYIEFGTGSKGNGSYPYDVKGLSYRDTSWVFTPDGGETFYRTNGQIAQPYMYPALEINKKKIQSMIDKEIQALLSKECKGGQ